MLLGRCKLQTSHNICPFFFLFGFVLFYFTQFEIQQKAKTARESTTHSELFSFQDIEMVRRKFKLQLNIP